MTWFYGARPVFAHPQGDRDSFRMFSAQLICQGACKQVEIVKAFGVSAIRVKRSVKQYRQEGVQSFYRPRPRRGGTVMTSHVIGQAPELLNQGKSRGDTAGACDDSVRGREACFDHVRGGYWATA